MSLIDLEHSRFLRFHATFNCCTADHHDTNLKLKSAKRDRWPGRGLVFLSHVVPASEAETQERRQREGASRVRKRCSGARMVVRVLESRGGVGAVCCCSVRLVHNWLACRS